MAKNAIETAGTAIGLAWKIVRKPYIGYPLAAFVLAYVIGHPLVDFAQKTTDELSTGEPYVPYTERGQFGSSVDTTSIHPSGGVVFEKTPTPSPAKTSETCRTYTVKAGDNLTKIAAMYGVTVDALVGRNNIKDRNKIRTGLKLTIDDCAILPTPTKKASSPLPSSGSSTTGSSLGGTPFPPCEFNGQKFIGQADCLFNKDYTNAIPIGVDPNTRQLIWGCSRTLCDPPFKQ